MRGRASSLALQGNRSDRRILGCEARLEDGANSRGSPARKCNGGIARVVRATEQKLCQTLPRRDGCCHAA
jgi:hypothetical protein